MFSSVRHGHRSRELRLTSSSTGTKQREQMPSRARPEALRTVPVTSFL